MFKSLALYNWRQFEDISINFHDRLTIITGANASGKTTILNILSNHYGWDLPLVSTPSQNKKTGTLEYLAGIFKSIFNRKEYAEDNIGKIIYQNDQVCYLNLPKTNNAIFNIEYKNQLGVKGVHIHSHRPTSTYRRVENILTQPFTKANAYKNYFNSTRERLWGNSSVPQMYFIKQTLISLATFGYGNAAVASNIEAKRTFEEFQDILNAILPSQLGFEKISIRIPEVVLITKSGDISLDALSGGLSAILDLAWQIFMYDNKSEKFVITIDEPENHLHPHMQKMILPNFLKAFPNAQFIITTHNPFVISSVEDSNVYVLKFNNDARVVSEYLENVNKASTSNEILREVLGIDSTLPNWVDKELDKIIRKYTEIGINSNTFNLFKSDLAKIGLIKFLPQTLDRFDND